jgi:hypothetical protein
VKHGGQNLYNAKTQSSEERKGKAKEEEIKMKY